MAGENIRKKIEEAEELIALKSYEEAAKILGKILANHEGATSYEMMQIGDSAKFVAEKIASEISDRSWHRARKS